MPKLEVRCEVYSRIVGYLRPIQDWNESKQHEFAARVTYEVNDKLNSRLSLKAEESSDEN